MSDDQDGSSRGSRLEESLKKVDTASEAIRLLKAAVDAKEKQLHSVLNQLEEKDKCVSARDATIDQRDAFISDALFNIGEEHHDLVKFLREQVKEVQGRLEEKDVQATALAEQLKTKDELIEKQNDEIRALEAVVENTKRDPHCNFQERGVALFSDAVKNGDVKTMEAFMAMGLDVDTQDKWQRTPLFYAAEAGHYSIIQTLLLQGANVDAKDKLGYTPLHRASACGNSEVVKKLLHACANVDAQDTTGRTPLHWASMHGYVDIAEKLIDHGARQDICDNKRRSAAEVACESRGHDIKKKLQDLLKED
ncbi:hypothetical protein BSKO_02701 [Bryopsis sp. KO-2023]|nr:hypothetical protein BSKO_02701 [Bryopsis sp. KO-2023]